MGKTPEKDVGRGSKGVAALVAGRRRAMGWTLQRLADRAQCTRSYLWMIERGQRGAPSDDVLSRIEQALGFDRGELIAAARWEATPRDVRDQVDSLRGTQRAALRLAQILRGSSLDTAHRSGELKRLVDELRPEDAANRTSPRIGKGRARPDTVDVPLINSIAAGYPREFTDLGYPAGVADQYVRVPGLTDPDAFACRVVGDSMLPEYREGDIVVFSPLVPVTSGQDCLARLEPDSETTFKRVYLERLGKTELIRLQPLNPAYPARTLNREQVAGLFAAVSVTRTVRPPIE